MNKEALFQQWIAMIEAGQITGSNLMYTSVEHRPALRMAFYAGLLANMLVEVEPS